jgi:hypothetical protein
MKVPFNEGSFLQLSLMGRMCVAKSESDCLAKSESDCLISRTQTMSESMLFTNHVSHPR